MKVDHVGGVHPPHGFSSLEAYFEGTKCLFHE